MKTKYKLLISYGLVFCLLLNLNVVNSKSTKLYFDTVENDLYFPAPPGESWISGNIMHIPDYQTGHKLGGFLGGNPLEGITESIFDVKFDLTSVMAWGHGTSMFEFTWDGLSGIFTGIVNFKIDPSTGIDGKVTLHGSGDYEGWKLFAHIGPAGIDNAIFGTVLIPN